MIRPFTRMKASAQALLALGIGSALIGTAAQAGDIRLGDLYSDHAVLQRDQPLHIWGDADPNVAIDIKLAGQSLKLTTNAQGRFEGYLPAQAAGGPYVLEASDAKGGKVSVSDVYLGDVWLCSGQSNMEFQVKYATNAWNESQNSANEAIRFVNIVRDSETKPLARLKTVVPWMIAAPATTGEASAVCYYMAKALQAKTKVATGMIHSSWGGTVAQAWVSDEGLRPLKSFDAYLDILKVYDKDQEKGKAQLKKVMDAWWDKNEPDAKTKKTWAGRDFNDFDWESIVPTGFWEDYGRPALVNFDGVVWYRNTLELTPAQAALANEVRLGPVDDADSTFVNGVMVGAQVSWNNNRVYKVPKGVFKAGKNVIAVRVLDSGGGGGLWGKPADRAISLSDGTRLPVPAEWRYKISARLSDIGSAPTTPWLASSGLTTLYNGMISPLTGYTLKGAAWYQGESNTYDPKGYEPLLSALIYDWRLKFKQPDLNFLIVQLADFGPVSAKPVASSWAEVRDVQRRVALYTPRTGLAVSIDFGDRSDIHPTQKNIVGQRLAYAARKVAYGENVPVSPNPTFIKRQGNDLIISFSDTAGGLVAYSSDHAIGFEACDAARVCRFVSARPSGETVVLEGANKPEVAFVRYAWADAPYTNLYSGANLPVVPFEQKVD